MARLLFVVFLRGLGSLGRSGFLCWFGLGCAVGDPEFGLGIFGTGFKIFQGAPSGVEVAEESLDHVSNGGIVPMRLG